MSTPEINQKKNQSYQQYLAEMSKSIKELNKFFYIDNKKSPDELYKHLVTIEDSLETFLNWIKMEKNSIRNFENITEWVDRLATQEGLDTSEFRSRLRIILLPQIEAFIQNLATGEKSALKVLDVVSKNLESINTFVKNVQQQNFKILTSIGYEPQDGTSYLDLALYNLYQGRFEDFNEQLKMLNENLKPPEPDSL
ncbi:MAG: hypothetical protein ACTSR2_02425 [Candidatus Hodarchaeales archaeon]